MVLRLFTDRVSLLLTFMNLVKLIEEYKALNLHDVIDHDRFDGYAEILMDQRANSGEEMFIPEEAILFHMIR